MHTDPPPEPVQPLGPQPQPPQGPVPKPDPVQRPSLWRALSACAAVLLTVACAMGNAPSREDDCRGPAALCKQDSAR